MRCPSTSYPARRVSGDAKRPDCLDLENPADLARLNDAGAYLRARPDRLVVIDEVRRAPGLFQILRGVIDDGIRAGRETGQLLLLGSGSIELLRRSSESLASRIAYLELPPIEVPQFLRAPERALSVCSGFLRS